MTQTPSTPSGTGGWFVTGQVEDTRVTPDGRVETGVKIMFRTSGGTDGSVFVPNTTYTAENVRAAISERVAAIESVAALSGLTTPAE